jgi:CRISPR/Cas system Type II protein with McrA/HNH and RuvC-like nuclease domain
MSRYVPVSLRAKVRKRFANCCGYCQTAERLTTTQFEIEHILPRSRSGETTFENLCLACSFCNLLKSDRIEFIDPVTGDRTPIFHPQRQVWTERLGAERLKRYWQNCDRTSRSSRTSNESRSLSQHA